MHPRPADADPFARRRHLTRPKAAERIFKDIEGSPRRQGDGEAGGACGKDLPVRQNRQARKFAPGIRIARFLLKKLMSPVRYLQEARRVRMEKRASHGLRANDPAKVTYAK